MSRVRPTAHNRRFLAYLAGSFCADSGYYFYSVAQSWLVLKLTNSPFWLGVVAGSGQAPFLLFSLLGGSLADRFDRRALIAIGNGAMAFVGIALALMVASGHASIALLALLSCGVGTVIAIEHPVDRVWLYELVAGEELQRAIALSSLEWSVARTLGPAFAGVLVAIAGIAPAFAVFALSLAPITMLALALGARDRGSPAAPAPAGEPSRIDGVLVPFALLVAAFTVGVSPYFTLLPDVAKNALHLDPRGYGLLAASSGVGAAAAAVVLTWFGPVPRKGRVVPASMAAGAALTFAFARTHDVTTAAVVLFALGAVDTLMYALANTYIQEIAGPSDRGRANGVFSLAYLGGIPVGNVLVGTLAGRIGSQPALAWSAVAAGCACALFWVAAPVARERG